MSIDISRKRFKPRKNYSGVVMQQGRVQLDADWNENVAIRDRRDRAETYDTFGGCVVPQTTPDAFEIQAVGGTLEIGPGRMYVDGLQAENHGAVPEEWDRHLAEERGTSPVSYGDQPYLPEADTDAPLPAGPGTHLAFLDVWEREVNHLIDPDLVEKAVGVDTTARTQTVWQVKVLANVGDINCATPDEEIPGWVDATAPSSGRISTTTLTTPADPNPCLLPPTGGYKGLENHTYRVEIHDGGVPLEPGDSSDPPPAGTATFKWSRDNGIVASEVTAIPALDRIRVASLGRDEFLRFHDGEWVEVTDDVRELHGRPGFLSKITVDEANSELILETALPPGEFPVDPLDDSTDSIRHTRVRRWDQSGLVEDTGGNDIVDLNAALAAGSIPVPQAGTPIELEAGVVVTFETPSGGRMRAGDAWVFAARTVDASVEELVAEPPYAIHHHYCRLALIHQPADGDPEVTDCRHPWGCGCCCEISVSPGQDVQAAVDLIPAEGGVVCLEVGVHRLRRPLRIDGRRNLVLKGCGPGSKLVLDRPRGETTQGAVVYVVGESRNIGIETLSVYSDQSAHLVAVDEASVEAAISETVLVNATDADLADCVVLGDCDEVTVEGSKLLGKRGVVQAGSLTLAALRAELETLRPQPVADEGDEDPAVPTDDVIAPPPPPEPPTVETVEELRIDDNLILAREKGIALLDVLVGRIRDNRILPALDRFDDFQRPQEVPTPAGVPVDEFAEVTAEDAFFDNLHEAFDALEQEEVDTEDLSELDAGIEACLLERVAVTGNAIQAEEGCRFHYSRRVSVSDNRMRVGEAGVATSYAFDLVVEGNRIEVFPTEEEPQDEPRIDIRTLGRADPTAAGVNLDIARGVRISHNDVKAPSGVVARRSSRSTCPTESGPSLLRVLGITKLWRVVVEFAWILLQIIRLLDPEDGGDQGPTKAEFEENLLLAWINLLAGKTFPAFLGKTLMEENRFCVERFGILARQILTLGGLRVVANRVTGARFTGIEIKHLFSIGLVDTISRWVGCILGFIIRFLQLFYRALCRFLEGKPMPDPQGGADSFTHLSVTVISGFMSLCARICGDPSDGGGDTDDGDRPTPEDLKDALGDLLDGACWLDDLIDGAYRISRNTVRGGGTGIWAGIDGTRVDDNRVTVDPDETVAWEAVVLGLLLAAEDRTDPETTATAHALMDLDRDQLLFVLFNTEDPLEAPATLSSMIGTFSSLVSPESPLRHWVTELEAALSSGGDADQAWRNLLAIIWGELRGYGIVLAGGDFCCTDNRVDAEKVCLATGRKIDSMSAGVRHSGKPPAVGGIWQFTNLAGFFEDLFRFYRGDPGQREQLIGTIAGLILVSALGKSDNRHLEVRDNQVREALVHGVSTRAVSGLRVVDLQGNHVRDAGRMGILFRGEGGTVRAHANAVRRTVDVYGFLEFQRLFPPNFARLIEVVGSVSDKRGGVGILASQNHGDGRRMEPDTSAVRLIGDSVGVIANHVHTDGRIAFRVSGQAGLFTDNMSNRINIISGPIEEPPNRTNLP